MCALQFLTLKVLLTRVLHFYFSCSSFLLKVTGRARLAGQPVGVIAVETGVVSKLQPADPGARENEHMCRRCAAIAVFGVIAVEAGRGQQTAPCRPRCEGE